MLMRADAVGHRNRLLLYLSLALAARLALYQRLPILLTHDSADYLAAAADTVAHGVLFSAQLADWRLPVYPLFLALVEPLIGFNSQAVVLAQLALGMGTLLLGIAIGRLLDSRLVSEILVLFLAFNPVYLLFAHLLMSEMLFLVLTLAFGATILACLKGMVGLVEGLAMGSLFTAALLTRSNALFFTLPLLIGLFVLRLRPGRAAVTRQFRNDNRSAFLAGVLLPILAGAGIWSWRNYQTTGVATPFTHNVNRNLLIYLAQHELIDPALPEFRRLDTAFSPRQPLTIYPVVHRLQRLDENPEALAGKLVTEQILNHPWAAVREMGLSLLHFSGLPAVGALDTGRDDVLLWFEHIVSNLGYMDEINRATATDPSMLAFQYHSISQDSLPTDVLSKLGTVYLRHVRPLLALILLVLATAWLHRNGLAVRTRLDGVLLLFGSAYLLTWLAHALTLSDYDRFALPFDWVMVLLICCLVLRLIQLKQSRSQPALHARESLAD